MAQPLNALQIPDMDWQGGNALAPQPAPVFPYGGNPVGTSTTRPPQYAGDASGHPFDPVIGSGRGLPVTRQTMADMVRSAWKTAGAVSDGGIGMVGAIKGATKPTVWLHGTGGRHVDLSPDYVGSVTGSADPGVWFTQNKIYASQYAQKAADKLGGSPRIMEAELGLENPLVVKFDSKMRPLVNGKIMPWASNTEIAQWAKQNGHDGIVFPHGNFSEESAAAAVFDPRRIKVRDHGLPEGGHGDFDDFALPDDF